MTKILVKAPRRRSNNTKMVNTCIKLSENASDLLNTKTQGSKSACISMLIENGFKYLSENNQVLTDKGVEEMENNYE